jgi:hypothetical protein
VPSAARENVSVSFSLNFMAVEYNIFT